MENPGDQKLQPIQLFGHLRILYPVVALTDVENILLAFLDQLPALLSLGGLMVPDVLPLPLFSLGFPVLLPGFPAVQEPSVVFLLSRYILTLRLISQHQAGLLPVQVPFGEKALLHHPAQIFAHLTQTPSRTR